MKQLLQQTDEQDQQLQQFQDKLDGAARVLRIKNAQIATAETRVDILTQENASLKLALDNYKRMYGEKKENVV